jgi:diacylglycerol kinase family enzyme
VRALLIINPHATSANGRDATRAVGELAAGLDLDTAHTRYPSHARELAADAAADGYELIIPFGGDGTINETVNGLMHATVRSGPGPHGCPAIAPVPAGGANVFARSLGFPPRPMQTAELIAAAAKDPHWRTIGLGLAGDRYFTFSAGLGWAAEVVSDVTRMRARGRRSSPGLYMRAGLRRYYFGTDRRQPALTLYPGEDAEPIENLFMGIIANSSPWTYLGNHPVSSVPNPDFRSGLDVFALSRLRTVTTLKAVQQMLQTRDAPPHGRDVVTVDRLCELTFRASRPIALQVDGEYIGEVTDVPFRYVTDALRVLSLPPEEHHRVM